MPVNITKIATLKGHNGSVYTLAEGVSESTFFTGSSDHYAALWSLEKLEQENFAAKFPAIIYALCHIPEKKLLIAGTSAGSIHVLDLEKKLEVKSLVHHTGPVFDIKYSLKSNSFYSASGDGNFAICSLESLSLIKIKKLCDEKVRSIDVYHPSSEIAVASGDCMVRIFDLFSLEEKQTFKAHELSANVVRYSPDGNLLFTGGRDAHLNIWDARSYSLIKSIPAHNFAVYDIVFSPDRNLFATASRDKSFKIWNMNTLEVLARVNKENYEAHANSVNKLIWSTYKNYLISTGDDRMIMIWDVKQ
jgi:WD40 repeat protein